LITPTTRRWGDPSRGNLRGTQPTVNGRPPLPRVQDDQPDPPRSAKRRGTSGTVQTHNEITRSYSQHGPPSCDHAAPLARQGGRPERGTPCSARRHSLAKDAAVAGIDPDRARPRFRGEGMLGPHTVRSNCTPQQFTTRGIIIRLHPPARVHPRGLCRAETSRTRHAHAAMGDACCVRGRAKGWGSGEGSGSLEGGARTDQGSAGSKSSAAGDRAGLAPGGRSVALAPIDAESDTRS